MAQWSLIRYWCYDYLNDSHRGGWFKDDNMRQFYGLQWESNK